MKTESQKASHKAAISVPPGNFDAFLESLGQKDRKNVERHLDLLGEDPRHAKLWTRLVGVMTALAPDAVQTSGNFAVQFFVAEGKYRLQVFALEDVRNDVLQLYVPDNLEEAARAGVIGRAAGTQDDARLYPIRGQSAATLKIESLTAAKTTAAPEFFKHMLGWNRKAVRITLPASASEGQIHAAEMLCALAAEKLAPKPKPAAAAEPVKRKA